MMDIVWDSRKVGMLEHDDPLSITKEDNRLEHNYRVLKINASSTQLISIKVDFLLSNFQNKLHGRANSS